MIDSTAFLELEQRLGTKLFKQRLQLQTEHSALRLSPSGFHVYPENWDVFGPLVKLALKLVGLYDRAERNSLDYQVETATVPLRRLPSAFHGFRILHLSDLHLEGIIDRGKQLRDVLHSLQYDLCVITGDFRLKTYGDYEEAVLCMNEITAGIHCPEGIIGILGNHDFLEMVPGLEKAGIRMLLNEAHPIRRGSDTLWIAGLDDDHYYETHDIPKALTGIPKEDPTILLAHSPDILESACEAGIDYYLCGHSHGGQICLPGGRPVLNNCWCPRQYISGPWVYQNRMPGYTSRGTGCSLLPVRLACRPEITLHQLV